MVRRKSHCPKCKDIVTFIKPPQNKYFLCVECGHRSVDYKEK